MMQVVCGSRTMCSTSVTAQANCTDVGLKHEWHTSGTTPEMEMSMLCSPDLIGSSFSEELRGSLGWAWMYLSMLICCITGCPRLLCPGEDSMYASNTWTQQIWKSD